MKRTAAVRDGSLARTQGPDTEDSERGRLRRTLAQNFLRGQPAVSQFLGAAGLGPDDLVLEVGAGTGALTAPLAARCREVMAYELDPHFARPLAARHGGVANLRVVCDDFLALDPPTGPFKVVGNVPFSLTSKIVDWCLQAPTLSSATLITQLEYAKKRSGAYGRWSLLTVLTWPEFEWRLRGRIARTEFRPRPRVDAGILHLARRKAALVPPPALRRYRRLVELGFEGRGGSLYASLSRRHPARHIRAAFRAASLDTSRVVAFVTPEQWLLIFQVLEEGED